MCTDGTELFGELPSPRLNDRPTWTNIHQYVSCYHLIHIKTYVYVCMLIVFLIHTYSTIVLSVLLFFFSFFLLSSVYVKLTHTISILCLFHTYCISVMLRYFFFVCLFVYFIWIVYIREKKKKKKKQACCEHISAISTFVCLISALEWRLLFSSVCLPIITSKFVFFCLVLFFCFRGRSIKMGAAWRLYFMSDSLYLFLLLSVRFFFLLFSVSKLKVLSLLNELLVLSAKLWLFYCFFLNS